MYLQHQDGFGRTNLIASSPECFYNHAQKTVSSAASLSVNADNGLLHLEGVGFFGNFTNMTLHLSNKVETRIREDIATHVRFLVALPLLILAEVVVHMRFRPLVEQFTASDLIRPADRPRFRESIESSFRLRNSVVAEVILLLVVFTGEVSVNP
jgi:hypothetical protein